jgi:TPR repeat protein
MGYAPGYYALGYYCYFVGYNSSTDDALAVKNFALAAEQNHREATYYLGYMYYGRGVDRDLTQAKEIWSRPRVKYHSQAQSLLAELNRAEEERQHAEEEVAKTREAPDAGDAAAQLQMARYLEAGTVAVACDKPKGLTYLRLAVDQGNASAQLYLAQCYDLALFDLPEDDAAALEWYRKAADKLSPAEKEALQAIKDEIR